ncbi:hypothetical protein EX30DRAFT_368854 [Ascodesmis nigricans]|uniref:Nephrocystin 3-like N-terminal domain-containing protein n=1 Tax=Ascodesmis nigricans TaxID=341454 RepID=A0A4S2N3H8_9PEZI|nr:hypothetical protein EX30DRAFT_368854 [Ascodesmis nigricans]
MADPLAVPAGVIGFVSFGITVLKDLITYYQDVKDQDDEIQAVNTQLRRPLEIFTDIQSRIQESNNTVPVVKRRNIESALEKCRAEVEELDKKLQAMQTLDPPKGLRAKTQARFKGLRYPFDGKRTVREIKDIAKGLNGHMMAVMNIFQTDVTLQADKKIDGVAEDVGNVGRDIQKIGNNLEVAEVDRFLRELPRAKGAAFDSQLWAHKSKCLQGTRVDLLNDIMEWCRSSASRPCIYWLSGMAGMGKSTIACTVSKTCDDEKRLGANFFFSKDDEYLKKAQNFVTTIALQLAEHIPDLKPLMNEAIKEKQDISEKTWEIQWRHLITGPLTSLDKKKLEGFVVIIDALDECENNDDIQSILGVLAQANELHTIRLKIFVTSRPETPIRKGFGDMAMKIYQLKLLQDVSRKTIDDDIRIYFQHELKDKITPEEMHCLIEKASGLFIWAVTACLFLRSSSIMKKND